MEEPSPRPSTYAFLSGSSSGRISSLAGHHAGGGRSGSRTVGDITGPRSGDRQRFGWRLILWCRLHQPVCSRYHGWLDHHPSNATACAKPAHGAPPTDQTSTRTRPAEEWTSQLRLDVQRQSRVHVSTRSGVSWSLSLTLTMPSPGQAARWQSLCVRVKHVRTSS